MIENNPQDNLERRIYKLRAKGNKKDADEILYGRNWRIVEQEYYNIYNDYLINLILNLITYENAPDTLDERFLEYNLRYFGYARVGGTDKNNVFVIGQNLNGEYGISQLGALIDTEVISNPFGIDESTDKLHYLTRNNYKNYDHGYVTLSNKYNYYLAGLVNTGTDFALIDRVAKTLAKIKASENRNIDMMRQQYVGFTKNKDLTAKNIVQQIDEGHSFIELDDSLGDINNAVTVSNFNIQDYLPSLKQAWNNEIDEMLTMLGINTVGIEKKERLVQQEAAANAQLTEASANVYLQARNQQLEILNRVLGTNIEATFNQQAFDQLVKLQEADQVGAVDLDDNNDGSIDNIGAEDND